MNPALLMPSVTLKTGDGLLVVDVQHDFMPGGALGIPDGDQIITPLNRVISAFLRQRLPVLYSRDWHPVDHCSFQAKGGPWPPHCVQHTSGATFDPRLHLPPKPLIFSKGQHQTKEQYSAFLAEDEAGHPLSATLRRRDLRRLFVAGLATDYCVHNTSLDLRRAGHGVIVLTDACRAVNIDPDDERQALRRMAGAGATLVATTDLGIYP